MLLLPLAGLYGAFGRARWTRADPVRVPVPVICVGNLVAGGAGKTPVVLKLIEDLTTHGRPPHVLLRGYGGREAGPLRVDPARHTVAEVGDEALLLAGKAPTWVCRDRAAGAKAAVAGGAPIVVMDDGFQNPQLAKDLCLLVIDGGFAFGNGRLLPAGPLREKPEDGLARAQAVVFLGEDRQRILPDLPAGLPVYRADLASQAPKAAYAQFQTDPQQQAEPPRYLAFAGIGRPEKFFQSLRERDLAPVETRAFADHHPYSPQDLQALLARAEALGARLITTEKDLPRLPAAWSPRLDVLPVEVRWRDADSPARLRAATLAATATSAITAPGAPDTPANRPGR